MSSPESSESDLPVVDPATPVCRHLRNKGMYVYTDAIGAEEHDDYDNTIYWCNLTMKNFGPDDEYVGRDECQVRSRTCYEPL
jgi:hypothetical protein